MIHSRIDFGDSIFIYACLSSLNLSKLQSIFTASANLIGGLPSSAHIAAFLGDAPLLVLCPRPVINWLSGGASGVLTLVPVTVDAAVPSDGPAF